MDQTLKLVKIDSHSGREPTMAENGGDRSSHTIDHVRDLRVNIHRTGRKATEAVTALATEKNWSNEFIPELHTRLLGKENRLPKAERIFRKVDTKPSSPRLFAGWLRLWGLPNDSYISRTDNPKRIFQAIHTLRLHRTLQELGIIQGAPALAQDFEELNKRYEFLCRAARAIDPEDDTSSEEQQPGSEFKGLAYTPTGDVPEADALRLIDPRIAGRHERAGIDFVRGLWANVEIDDFREREADLEFLRRFLNAPDHEDPNQKAPLALALLTGDGGDGKTRLALQFFRELEVRGYRFGFLSLSDLRALRSWRPTRPTFIVIDYVSQAPVGVRDILAELINAHYARRFERQVRVLLLERRSSDALWMNDFLSPDRNGNSVRANIYCEPQTQISYPLTSLTDQALLNIMHGRLGELQFDDKPLLAALRRVDPRLDTKNKDTVAPRPLFAAATGQAIAELSRENRDIQDVAQKLEQKHVLSRIIQRERKYFWSDPHAADPVLEGYRLALHENLLIFSTIVLDLPRQFFKKLPRSVKSLMPSRETLDENRFERMSGADTRFAFKRFEPDILGEYFVLTSLRNHADRQALIDAALEIGGRFTGEFVRRCAIDFPVLIQQLNYFEPSHKSAKAAETFFGVVANIRSLLKEEEAVALMKRANKLTDHHIKNWEVIIPHFYIERHLR